MDKYGKIDIDKLREPIIYSFVTKEMLEKLRMKPESESNDKYEKEESDNESENCNSDDENDDDMKKKPPPSSSIESKLKGKCFISTS